MHNTHKSATSVFYLTGLLNWSYTKLSCIPMNPLELLQRDFAQAGCHKANSIEASNTYKR